MSRSRLLVLTLMLAAAALLLLLIRPLAPLQTPPEPRAEPSVTAATPAEVARAISLTEAEALLEAGRPWRAARLLREYLERRPEPEPAALLLAARAEAGWGGWDHVRELLEGRPWLEAEAAGEGLYLLGRALEADTAWGAAAEAYRRFLGVRTDPADSLRAWAELRAGLAQLRVPGGAVDEAMLRAARGRTPELAAWVDLLTAEALAARGDTARVRGLVANLDPSTFGVRSRRSSLAAYRAAGDDEALLRLALAYGGAASEVARSEYALEAARAAARLGRAGTAREQLRSAVGAAPQSRFARDAARELEALGGLSDAERLAVARVLDRHGPKRRAAEAYRAWLDAGVGTAGERRDVRLALGRALFDAGEFAEAESALRPLVDAPAATAAEALYLLGRAQYRAGRQDAARQTYLQVAQRFPRTQPGAEALYLVADMHHEGGDLARARQVYRRVADEFPGRDRAGLALMRLAGMAWQDGDPAAAARFWNEYRADYPRGQLWLQATFWSARALEAGGDRDAAAARYREVRQREPQSYYAHLAAERLGESFWPVPMGPEPTLSPAGARRVADWMRTVDLLLGAGLAEEAEAETERLARLAGSDPGIVYPLAEALNARGFTVRGIRLGGQILAREGRANPRLLRILYPFPYRNVIEAEAREMGLDPLVAAALIRQESLFSARISSPVGARGLMQVMPQTGRAVAAGLGIERWDDELLFQPEINVHLGTRYLAEQMRAYDGSLPSVFSAYNAGPHRVDAWRRYPEYGDEELFTERIPFRETRDYVKILTRNLEIYRGLYGEG